MIQIRYATLEDTASIKTVEDECFLLPWHTKSIQIFTKGIPTHRCFVAVDTNDNDRIVGYIAAIIVEPEAEIANIAVLKAYRNQRIGRAILTYLLGDLKDNNVKSVFLEVRKSNASAIHLYQEHGFISVGVRKDYYNHPKEDALILRCDVI